MRRGHGIIKAIMACASNRIELLGHRRGSDDGAQRCERDPLDVDIAHAAMMPEPANRFMAWPAGKLGCCLDCGGDRVERCPMPWAGRSEDADARGAECSGHMQEPGIVRYRGAGSGERENGIAQVRTRQVADTRRVSLCDFSGDVLFG